MDVYRTIECRMLETFQINEVVALFVHFMMIFVMIKELSNRKEIFILIVFLYNKKRSAMDAHKREKEFCSKKRPRLARECALAHSFIERKKRRVMQNV